jgi:hypothetical protein
LVFLLGALVAIVAASQAFFAIMQTLLTFNVPGTPEEKKTNSDGILMLAFKSLIFPAMYLKLAVEHFKKRMKMIDESRVQIVEVTLNPRLVIKN